MRELRTALDHVDLYAAQTYGELREALYRLFLGLLDRDHWGAWLDVQGQGDMRRRLDEQIDFLEEATDALGRLVGYVEDGAPDDAAGLPFLDAMSNFVAAESVEDLVEDPEADQWVQSIYLVSSRLGLVTHTARTYEKITAALSATRADGSPPSGTDLAGVEEPPVQPAADAHRGKCKVPVKRAFILDCFSVPARTLDDARQNGRVPCVKIGGQHYLCLLGVVTVFGEYMKKDKRECVEAALHSPREVAKSCG